MDKKQLLVGLIALIVGLGAGYFLNGGNSSTTTMNHSIQGNMQGEMDDMMAGLEGKTGDEFDKAFLAEMIIHHEGAVDMAEAALKNAQHDEIKTMANAIISAQTAEIAQMKAWLSVWYGE